ncbi:MAG: DUF3169 family protein [Eubacterium sp.]|nr:DUF3169 family protein [Eubacterium sp.]
MNKKKSITIKFFVTLLLSTILGGIVGVITIRIQRGHKLDFSTIFNGFKFIAPYLLIAYTVIAFICALYILSKARSMAKTVDPEDYDSIDIIMEKLEKILSITNFTMIISFFLFTATSHGATLVKSNYPLFIASMVAFVFTLTWIVVLQSKAVSIIKQFNEEKEGEVLDLKFKDVWIKSCDEAEKYQIYKAGYHAFSEANIVCIILWIIAHMSCMAQGANFMSAVFVFIIWATLNISYVIHSKDKIEVE